MSEEQSAALEGAEPEDMADGELPEAEESINAETEELEAVETDEGETEDSEAEEVDEFEFDFGGNKFRVAKDAIPEELAGKIDEFTKGTWSDYTRKSQAVAEQAKSIQAREETVAKMESLNGEALQVYSHGLQLRGELEQLSQIDLQSLWQSDPDRARQISDSIAAKQAEFQRTVAEVANKESELSASQQAELARREEEGRQIVERRIKGFSEKAPEVVDYVVSTYGMDKSEADKWPLNPITAEMAYKAMMFDRMQAQARKKPGAKPAAAPVAPMKGKGAAKATTDPDKMSTEQWMRWREQQLAKKAS